MWLNMGKVSPLAVEACYAKTLQIITKIHKLQAQMFYNIQPTGQLY